MLEPYDYTRDTSIAGRIDRGVNILFGATILVVLGVLVVQIVKLFPTLSWASFWSTIGPSILAILGFVLISVVFLGVAYVLVYVNEWVETRRERTHT